VLKNLQWSVHMDIFLGKFKLLWDNNILIQQNHKSLLLRFSIIQTFLYLNNLIFVKAAPASWRTPIRTFSTATSACGMHQMVHTCSGGDKKRENSPVMDASQVLGIDKGLEIIDLRISNGHIF